MEIKIYKITNLVNGKIYIGQTRKTVEQRFQEHVTIALSTAKSRKKYYIHHAILKYGPDSFKFEQIDVAHSFNEAKDKEASWITRLDSNKLGVGYNLVVESRNGIEFQAESTKRKLRVAVHKSKKKGLWGYGIEKIPGKDLRFGAYVTVNYKKYSKCFETLKDAQIAYDKASLYLFGEEAILNFPNLKEAYLREDLQMFWKWFSSPRSYLLGYRGVTDKASKGLFTPQVVYKKKFIPLGHYLQKEEAARIRDIVYFYLIRNKTKLNFPDEIINYTEQELKEKAEFYLKNGHSIDPKKTEFRGVYYDIKEKMYRAFCPSRSGGSINLGLYHSKEIAAEARDRIVLFLNPESEDINFLERKNKYLSEDLEGFYKKTRNIKAVKKAKYKGVRKLRSGFEALAFPASSRPIFLGVYPSEVKAAEMHDKVQYYLTRNPYQLNFPDDLSSIDLVEAEKLYYYHLNRIKPDKPVSSQYVGVYHRKDTGMWSMSFKTPSKTRIRKDFSNEIDAAEAFDRLKIFYNMPPVNFPNKNYCEDKEDLFVFTETIKEQNGNGNGNGNGKNGH